MPPHADKNTPQTTHQRANIKYHERRQPDARTKRHDDVNLLEDVRPRRLPVRRHAPIRRKRHNLARQILPRFPIRHTLHHRKPARPHPTTSMPWAGLDEDVSRRETTMRVDASERFHANPHQDIRPPAPHRGRPDDGTAGRRDDGTTGRRDDPFNTDTNTHDRIIASSRTFCQSCTHPGLYSPPATARAPWRTSVRAAAVSAPAYAERPRSQRPHVETDETDDSRSATPTSTRSPYFARTCNANTL